MVPHVTNDRLDWFLGDIRRRAKLGLEELGKNEKDFIRHELMIEIEKVGRHVIRSLPGEPPRSGKRKQPLRDSIKYGLYSSESVDGVQVAAGPAISPEDGQDYATKLESGNYTDYKGRPGAKRPYMDPSKDRVAAREMREVVEAMTL